MGNRTLYVRKEDEDVWQEAASLGDATLSELATQGLQLVMAEQRAAAESGERGAPTGEDAQAVIRFGRELRKLGWEHAGAAFARACLDYGAARSRAKRKAEERLGPEGRKRAALKAQEAKGPEGRKAAARKAWRTRKAEA
jgi:hypothetical protein